MTSPGDKSARLSIQDPCRDPAPIGFYRLAELKSMAFAAPLLVAFLLSACGPRITNSNIEVVNKQFELSEKLRRGGVSPKEVESILGQPQHAETKTIPLETQKKEVEVVRYYYEQDGQTIEMHFLDNKLIARVPHFNSPKPTAPTPSPK